MDQKEDFMRKYECLLLFSPELSLEERSGIVQNLSDIIARDGGKVLLVDEWGMRELAYPVKKVMRGFYVRLEFNLPPLFVQELERNIRITEGIFKFVTVKLDDAVETEEAA